MKLLGVRSNRIVVYIVALLALWAFAGPGSSILQTPVAFYLKDRLHEPASRIALFSTLIGLPAYVGFVFGFTRDHWKPFGLGDRGYMLLFAPLILAVYLWYSLRPVSYVSLTAVMVVLYTLAGFLGSALSGLTTELAQRHAMSGRLSSAVQITGCAAAMITCTVGGWLTGKVSLERLLQSSAVLSMLLFAFALLKPKSVFDGMPGQYDVVPEARQPARRDLSRLFHSRVFLSAALLWCMWSFGPGGGTPLFFYLTNTLKLTSQQYGWFNALTNLAYIPGAFLYALIIRRFAFRKILFWSTVLGVPQFLFLLCIRNVASAMFVSTIIGVVGAMVTFAFYDLILRACPKGLEGTALALIAASAALVINLGNQLGSVLYERGGFALPVAVTTVTYALMVPCLRLVPHSVTSQQEGEDEVAEVCSEDEKPAACGELSYA